MARPSYAAELDKYVNEQLAQARQLQAQAQPTQQQAMDQSQVTGQWGALPPPMAPPTAIPGVQSAAAPGESSAFPTQDEDVTLPYGPPRAPMPPAAPRQAPPPTAPAPGGYAGGYTRGYGAPSPAPSTPVGAPMRSHGPIAPTVVAPVQRAPILNAVALDEEITRLQQMRVWLSDPLMCAVIDKFIGQRMGAAERRQVYYSVAAGVVSLIIGWLLSAISPASVLVGLFHR